MAWRTTRKLDSGGFQEEIDTHKAFFYTTYLSNHRGLSWDNRDGLKDISKETQKLQSTSYRSQKFEVRQNIHGQVYELFSFLKERGSFDPYPQPLQPQQEEPVEAMVDLATMHTESEIRRDQEIIDKPIHYPQGNFTLRIAKSSIDHPEAGFGNKPRYL